MDQIVLFVFLSLAALGHCGLIVWAYNSINATGLRRTTIKLVEKFALLIGLVTPLLFLFFEIQTRQPESPLSFSSLHVFTKISLFLLVMFAAVRAPFWIESRPVFTLAKDQYQVLGTQLWKPLTKGAHFRGRKFSLMGKLPFNEIGSLEANSKRLLLEKLPSELVGLKIAHISDIHLTGQMDHRFYRQAFEWLQAQSPDMFVLSGDIVDYDRCVSDIRDVFSDISAPLGKFFVLGNHDRRIANPLRVCEELVQMGWHDVGIQQATVAYRGVEIRVIGNELPWFRRHGTSSFHASEADWTLGISHSPDQFGWGVSMNCGLLLCGHTHGGQIRFPWIGPVVAPSWHGSRYASGVFVRKGTLMHVSRGMSGIHPYRWGCPPEVSLLELSSFSKSS